MQNRKLLLEGIDKLIAIESAKLNNSVGTKKHLHAQKFYGLKRMKSKLAAESGDVSQEDLYNLIKDTLNRFPRFAEGVHSEIKKFLNEVAPGWGEWEASVSLSMSDNDDELSSSSGSSVSSSSSSFFNAPNVEEKTQKLHTIYILGAAGCGKTSIVKSFLGQDFSETYKKTTEVDCIYKKIHHLRCQIVDVPVQQQISFTYYINPPSAIIYVFDITRAETFQSIHFDLRSQSTVATVKFLEDAYKLPKMLVANKIDKRNKSHQELLDIAKKYAKDNGMQFAEVAANKPQSVKAMFNCITDLIKVPDEKMLREEEVGEEDRSSRRENCVMM